MRRSDATRRIETRQDDKERRKRNVEHGSPYLQTGMIRHTAQENTARNNKTACWTPETHKRYEVKKNGMLQDEIGDSRRNATRNGTPRGGTHHHGTHRPHGDGNTHTPPPQAHADNAKTAQTSPQTSPDDNIEISVPTSVPCLVKADGTIIAPIAET